ncbi:MAG: metallophosphoesterase [Clostridia bacterium]|nr:metallophosphoesterase [Clostridia bacterium]
MKKLTVVSDTHGNAAAIQKLFPVFAESDYIIHLGDTSSDGQIIRREFPEKTLLLNGNCDLSKLGEDELVLEVESVKIFACHGDKYGVKRGYDNIAYKAEQEGCKVALFGHTHAPIEKTTGGIMLFNPGTLRRYTANTYLYLVINGDKVVGKICSLQNT